MQSCRKGPCSTLRSNLGTFVVLLFLGTANADTTCNSLAGPSNCGSRTGCTYKVAVTCGTLSCRVDYSVTCGGGSYTCGKTQYVLSGSSGSVCLSASCPCSCCVAPGAGATWSSVTGCNFDHGCS